MIYGTYSGTTSVKGKHKFMSQNSHNTIRDRFGNIPKMTIESTPSTLYLRGVEAGDAGDYACEAVDARSGAVVFTAVTTLTVSGDFTN